jgi:hypothetical protein
LRTPNWATSRIRTPVKIDLDAEIFGRKGLSERDIETLQA